MAVAGMAGAAGRRRLWVEFAALFGAVPVAIAVILPASSMFPATALGVALLHAVAGQIVSLLGLGMFFYAGNVARPF